ncbi:MAG: spermidine/putrescine ABC transporter substrate-binding protein [Candidatus Cloacimonetes bacterium]|nr:spermidine/putrescine ABC transporter substrate-binding protein [Candidatus Cloacimonadota bacterium]
MIHTILLLFLLSPVFSRVVYVYNWSEYIPREVIEEFEKESGIKVKLSTYDSNEILYTKLKILNSGGYDLVFPSTYFVEKMISQNMLHPLEKEKLPNISHLDSRLLGKPYDKENRFSLPYLWGNSAILYNRGSVSSEVSSFKDLWKPEFKKSVLMLDDMREAFAVSLKSLGYSANSTEPKQIQEAYQHLKALMPNIRIFNSESPRQIFLTKEVVLGLTYNGDAYKASLVDPSLVYVYPTEGATLWVDSVVIPRRAKNKLEAHEFLNFLMRPEVSKIISDSVGYASPNRSAQMLQDDSIRLNTSIYPPDSIMQNMEILSDIGQAVFLYERYWEELKVQ